jgi:hypothetical protein
MALIPQNQYAGQIETGDAGYPQGKARNVAVSGDGTGTPLDANWVNDIWGFLQALLSDAGATPTNSPDQVGASQYLAAIKRMVPRALFRFNPTLSGNDQVTWLYGDSTVQSIANLSDSIDIAWNEPLVDNVANSACLVSGSAPVFIDATMSSTNVTYIYARNTNGLQAQLSAWNNRPFTVAIFGVPA